MGEPNCKQPCTLFPGLYSKGIGTHLKGCNTKILRVDLDGQLSGEWEGRLDRDKINSKLGLSTKLLLCMDLYCQLNITK